MPKQLGSLSEPGLARTRERKCAEGAWEVGVIPNRLEVNVAPSGSLPATGVIRCAITLLRGSERPRTPSKSSWRGSFSTKEATAVGGHRYDHD